MKRIFCLLLALAALGAMAMPLQASTPIFWTATPWGYVDNVANWDLGYVPGTGTTDTVLIDNGGLALADATHAFGPNPFNSLVDDYGIYLGNTGSGGLQQSGGTIATNHGLLLGTAAGSYGYYGLSGSTSALNVNATGGLAGVIPMMIGYSGMGVYNQTGGTAKVGQQLWAVGFAGGTGVMSQMSVTGGTLTTTAPGSQPVVIAGWGGSNGIVNVGGTGDMNLEQGVLFMSQGGGAGTLNLGDVKSSMGGAGGVNGGGGVLRTTEVFGYGSDYFNGDALATTNFHGGTLQVTSSTPPPPYYVGCPSPGFFNMNGGKAYVYSEGAVIDTQNFNAEVNTGLSVPTGNGVSGITLSTGGSGFIGEPIVTLTDSGGTGTGATARAIVDLDPAHTATFGTVTGIVVTNPGVNYSGTVTATFTGGGAATVAPTVDTIATAANTSGGLRKTGLGRLSLNGNCTYTGATTVEGGTLYLNGITLASSGITVKSGAALAGVSNTVPDAMPVTTVESGGAIDLSVPAPQLVLAGLNVQNLATLKYGFSDTGAFQQLVVAGDITHAGALPVNVEVSYTGTFLGSQPVLIIDPGSAGVLDSAVTFSLPGGKAVLDSDDGRTKPATVEKDVPNRTVWLVAGGLIDDPAWNKFEGGNWTETTYWGPPNTVPNSGNARAMFTGTLGSGTIPINLNTSPQLSSMIFQSNSGESYDIASATNHIVLNSEVAQNWHISVFSGSHTVDAAIKIAKGSGQSAIRLADGSHLTLSKIVSDATAGAGINLEGNFNGAISGTAGTGILTLSGANTYTGPVTVKNAVLEVASIDVVANANPLGKSGMGPANLVLNNSMLHYAGTAAVSTDRGFTVQGNSTVLLDGNAGFTGQLVGDASSTLTVTGAGTLNLGNTGTSVSSLGTLNIVNGKLALAANSKLDVVSGTIGCNGSTGDLTVNDGGVLTSTSAARFEIAHIGSSNVVLSGTSTTSPAKLSIGGTAWMGVSLPGEAPSTMLIDLSGTAEMHIGTTGPVGANAHVGLGTDTTGTINMTGDSKFSCEIVIRPDGGAGWLDMGDLGGTANVNLSNNASFSVPHTGVGLGASTGGKGHITLNGSATFSTANYVYVGVADAAEASITLNGGTFTAPYFVTTGPGVINFNGGALKASAASDNYIQGATFAVNVQAGGAKIDTNGFAVKVAHALQHDPALGTTDGGLTKLGAGTLTLNTPNTYTGPTVVKDGTLLVKKDTIVQAISTAPNAMGNRGGAGDGPYSLGRIFEVKPANTIQVTQLGVFDDAGDGLAGTHTVYLTDVSIPGSETNLTSVPFAIGTEGSTYNNGFRFINLPTPITLNPGRYQIWVDSLGGDVDKFGQLMSTFNVGSGAITLDEPSSGITSYYSLTPGTRPDQLWETNDAAASFVYYDPGALITPSILLSTTPVLLGGAAGSTPKLDIQGANQTIASLADVAGATVKGVVTNSDSTTPVVLILGATSGTTSYSGSITGNLSLVKSGGSAQTLSGPLTYTGNTTVTAGTLIVSSINNHASVIVSGGTLTAGSLRVGSLATGAASATAVPEPGTMMLLALAGLAASLYAWRRK